MSEVTCTRLSTWCAGLALVVLVLAACGADTPAGAATPTRSPAAAAALLFLTDSRGDAAGNAVFQVEADQQGKQRWAVSLPAPGDALAAANGVVYVGAGQTVLALDAQTGHTRWQVTASPQVRTISVLDGQIEVDTGGGFAGQEHLDSFSLGGRLLWQDTPPAVQDIPAWLVNQGVFYTVEGDGGVSTTLVARNAANGTERWRAPLQIDSPVQAFQTAGPDDLLVVTEDSLIVAARRTGATIWQRTDTQAVAPQTSDGTLYAFCVDQPASFGGAPPIYLRALALTNGSLRWQQPLPAPDAGFLSSGQSLTVGTLTPQSAYLVDSPDFQTLHAWTLTDGSLRWSFQAAERVTALVADAQRVYLVSAGRVGALQADTGQVRWRAANPEGLTTLREEGGELVGANPLTSTLVGYDLAAGQRLWRVQPQALDQWLVEGASG